MELLDLILKPSLFIASTYFLLQSDFLSSGLINKLTKRKKLYIAGSLGLFSLISIYLFSAPQIELYSIAIIIGGNILGFPYGLGMGIAVGIVGSTVFGLPLLLRAAAAGVISDFYVSSWLKNISKELKRLISSLVLAAAMFKTGGEYYLALIYLISFYGVFWVIDSRRKQVKLIEFKENELANARRARDSLQHLHSINKKMVTNFDLSETCEELIKISCQQLGVKNGGLLLLNEDKDQLELETRYGLKKNYVRNFKLEPPKDYLCQVVADGEIFIVDDMKAKNYNCYSMFIGDGFKSLLLAPITIEDKLEGLMFFVHPQASFFSNEDLIPIQTIVDQVPLVIERAEIFQKMERNVASLSMLQQASQIINSTLEQQEVFDLTIDVVMGAMGVSMAGLFLYQPEAEEVELVSTSGLPNNEERSKLVAKAEEVSLEIINEGTALIRDDVTQESQDMFATIDVRSVMFIPLKIRNKIIGAISVAQTDYKRKFKEADRRFITTLANQVAVAIENARMYNQMERLATRDGLTKLYNHSIFQERLGEEIEAASRYDRYLSLLMMDIDNFKDFNDSYGHQAGDQILKKLAQLLQREVRGADIVARYGGEEFAVILPEANKEEALMIGQRLNEAIKNLDIDHNDLQLSITISIGVATYQPDQSQEEFINSADQALYQAKAQGKDQVCTAGELSVKSRKKG